MNRGAHNTIHSQIESPKFGLGLALAVGVGLGACSTTPPPPPAAPPPDPVARAPSPIPTGPTRTDFKTIAKKLMSRCVRGGWINAWRAEQPDVDVARPKIRLLPFEDRTSQDLDPTYLNTILAQRMRLSGAFDLAGDNVEPDFLGKGTLLRLAEGNATDRYAVYIATLELQNPKSGRVVHACEATVKGELGAL